MNLCTLPASVSSKTFSINPHIDVVLFVNDTHLMLCRKSGQQVWSSRIHASKPCPSKLEWSTDGNFVAMVFPDGSMVVYDLINGRIQRDLCLKQQFNNGEGVSSVAWSTTQGVQSNNREINIENFDWWNPNYPRDTALSAIGTQDGKLRLSLYGALEINDINVGTEPVSFIIAKEAEGEYAAVCGSELVVYQIGIMGEGQKYNAMQSAQALRLMENVTLNCMKIKQTLENMRHQNQQFFKSIDQGHGGEPVNLGWSPAQLALVHIALTGQLDEAALEWISVQHEQGFKKWYKAVSQSWDLLLRTIQDELIRQITRLLLIIGTLNIDCSDLQNFLELIYQLMKEIVSGQMLFEKQASFIEHVFTEEISRAICTTRVAKVDLSEIIDDLSTHELLGQISADWESKLVDSILPTKASLESQTTMICNQLKHYLKVQKIMNFGEKIKTIAPNKQDGYTLILESNTLIEISMGETVKRVQLEDSNYTLVCGESQNYAIGVNPISKTVCVDHRNFSLEFEPVAAVAREIAPDHLMACILSEDHQHYQFLEISLN